MTVLRRYGISASCADGAGVLYDDHVAAIAVKDQRIIELETQLAEQFNAASQLAEGVLRMEAKLVSKDQRIAELEALLDKPRLPNHPDRPGFEVARRARAKKNLTAENAALKEDSRRLNWQAITPANQPKVGDEMYSPALGMTNEYTGVIPDGWTHFRAINPPVVTKDEP